MISYPILTSKYIFICQKICLDKLKALNSKIRSDNIRNSTYLRCLKYFLWLNDDLIVLYKVLDKYSFKCNIILSIIISFHVTLQGYLLHAALFLQASLSSQKRLFLITVLQINLFLFVIIRQCALITKNHDPLDRINRQIYSNFINNKQIQNNIQIGNWIKLERLSVSGRFDGYAFRLFGYIRITNECYYMVIILF